jgi:hypothetical protein
VNSDADASSGWDESLGRASAVRSGGGDAAGLAVVGFLGMNVEPLRPHPTASSTNATPSDIPQSRANFIVTFLMATASSQSKNMTLCLKLGELQLKEVELEQPKTLMETATAGSWSQDEERKRRRRNEEGAKGARAVFSCRLYYTEQMFQFKSSRRRNFIPEEVTLRSPVDLKAQVADLTQLAAASDGRCTS